MQEELCVPTVNTDTQEEAYTTLAEVEATVADSLLKGENGWDIVNGFKRMLTEKILSTRVYIVPVLQNLDDIAQSMPEETGESFKAEFKDLLNAITAVSTAVKSISELHVDKKGKPDDFELPQIFELTESYNKQIELMALHIDPTIEAQLLLIQEHYGDQLKMHITEEQDNG